MARLAITGGTGFVGTKLIELALAAGHDVRALKRREQPAREGLTWIRGDLDNSLALGRLCEGVDAVIHAAGVVNARKRQDFIACNVDGTRAILAASTNVPRFVNVSSLAAREPQLSVYGDSKAEGDRLVMAAARNWAIVRPPAVYGPGDRETANFYKLVARGFALLPSNGRFSVIEVADLARALLALALTDKGAGQVFEIDDGTSGGLGYREMAEMIANALEKRPAYIRLPRFALKLGAAFDTLAASLKGTLPALSFDRAGYIAHPDWVADSAPFRALGIWTPEIPAVDGIGRTAKWYRAAGWI